MKIMFDIDRQQLNLGECNTPQETPGECVRLSSCEPLKNLIRKKPLTHQNRVFLRQSQCDYINDYPWVCCPKAKQAQFKVRRYSALSSKNKINDNSDSSELLKAGESVCGKPFKSLEDRIYGGDETSLGEFPW